MLCAHAKPLADSKSQPAPNGSGVGNQPLTELKGKQSTGSVGAFPLGGSMRHDNLAFFRAVPLALLASAFICWTAYEVACAIVQLVRWAL